MKIEITEMNFNTIVDALELYEGMLMDLIPDEKHAEFLHLNEHRHFVARRTLQLLLEQARAQ